MDEINWAEFDWFRFAMDVWPCLLLGGMGFLLGRVTHQRDDARRAGLALLFILNKVTARDVWLSPMDHNIMRIARDVLTGHLRLPR